MFAGRVFAVVALREQADMRHGVDVDNLDEPTNLPDHGCLYHDVDLVANRHPDTDEIFGVSCVLEVRPAESVGYEDQYGARSTQVEYVVPAEAQMIRTPTDRGKRYGWQFSLARSVIRPAGGRTTEAATGNAKTTVLLHGDARATTDLEFSIT